MMNPLLNNVAGGNSMFQNLSMLKNMLSGKDPNAFAQMLANQNPQFAQFLQANRGKTPEQIAQEHGIDLERVKNFMK